MPFCSLERTNVCGLKSDDSYCIKTCNLSSLCDVLTLLKRYRVILKMVSFGIFRIILVSKEEKNFTILPPPLQHSSSQILLDEFDPPLPPEKREEKAKKPQLLFFGDDLGERLTHLDR